MSASTYRGWSISQGRWPEPAWAATHPNYDASYEGAEEGWVVANGAAVDARSREELVAEIDAWIEENDPVSSLTERQVAELMRRDAERMVAR